VITVQAGFVSGDKLTKKWTPVMNEFVHSMLNKAIYLVKNIHNRYNHACMKYIKDKSWRGRGPSTLFSVKFSLLKKTP
jgi:hypothetical protein